MSINQPPKVALHLASYNDFVVELLAQKNNQIEILKVGNYYTKEKLISIKDRYPHLSFVLHLDTYLSRKPLIDSKSLDRPLEFYHLLKPIITSAHIAFGSSQFTHIENVGFFPTKSAYIYKSIEDLAGTMRTNLKILEDYLNTRVLLENIPSIGPAGEKNEIYNFCFEPKLINQVLTREGGFLLDLAHARVTAFDLGYRHAEEYLEKLPLHKTEEIHISSPRLINGKLIDINESLIDLDYKLLRWVLKRARRIKVISLEYWLDKYLIRDQFIKIYKLINT